MVTREVTTNASTVMDAQREFISAHEDAGTTDIVVQVYVPDGGDFGVLIPAPAQPTIDPSPIPSADLDALDTATRPKVTIETFTSVPEKSSGCGVGCGGAKGLGTAQGPTTTPDTGVHTGASVTVGPVTATPLTASDSNALNGWLAQNGYVIPAQYQSVVDSYVGPGQWFVALKRADTAAGGVSVGVHFSVPVVHKEMELKFAQLGAAAQMAFTVFIVDAQGVGPDNAAALTLDDLAAGDLQSSYPLAIFNAVRAHSGKAWVVEGVYDRSTATGSLAALTDGAQGKLTRLSTVVSSDELTYDASFNAAAPASVPTSRTVSVQTAWRWPHGGGTSLGALAFAGLFLRGRRRRR